MPVSTVYAPNTDPFPICSRDLSVDMLQRTRAEPLDLGEERFVHSSSSPLLRTA